MIMLLVPVAFYYLAVASVASALLAVTRRDPVHSMLWVLALFLHVAGIFLLLSAEFLAAVQVIVYAGAILVFYLFVLMLLDVPDEKTGPRFSAHWPLAAAGGLGLTALVWIAQIESAGTWSTVSGSTVSRTVERPHAGSLVEVGQAIFGPFALPFEMTSLVLLAAIVGAVVLARRRAASIWNRSFRIPGPPQFYPDAHLGRGDAQCSKPQLGRIQSTPR